MARKQKREERVTKKGRRTERQTTPETPDTETSALEVNAETMETQLNQNETEELSVVAVETLSETATDEATGPTATADVKQPPAIDTGETAEDGATGPAAADVEQLQTGDASEVAQPDVDSATALALRRLRETPRCCCGCGLILSNPKKHFIIGHDGKAKATVRKIMRGELQPQDAPPELILRHMEIKFIVLSPQFRPVVEAWRELCGITLAAAGQ